jgi:hypothetical protein
MEVVLQPAGPWGRLLARPAAGTLRGEPLARWGQRCREELGLVTDRPIIATGHQTLLWHPGILAKYIAAQSACDATGAAGANLIVDQHAGAFDRFEVPLRRRDGSLAVETIVLTMAREGVPMMRHPAFIPPVPRALDGALPSVRNGVRRILEAVAAHADAPNAAIQMARALDDLMAPWVRRMPAATASDLIRTSLGRALIEQMVEDPRRCAESYNAAVAAVPEAGIAALAISGGAVQLPMWRLGPDDRRVHADDHDARSWLSGHDSPVLLPRALLLTFLVRCGMCDLFVHGTGGARYDVAMERWAAAWLGITPGPSAVASATLKLPLRDPQEQTPALPAAQWRARRAWHDPESAAAAPGPRKRELLEQIAAAPRGSRERLEVFRALHRELAALRQKRPQLLEQARRDVELARRAAREAPIADRRDWPFPLYPQEMIDALAEAITVALSPR